MERNMMAATERLMAASARVLHAVEGESLAMAMGALGEAVVAIWNTNAPTGQDQHMAEWLAWIERCTVHKDSGKAS